MKQWNQWLKKFSVTSVSSVAKKYEASVAKLFWGI
jgi:hypothetical protein